MIVSTKLPGITNVPLPRFEVGLKKTLQFPYRNVITGQWSINFPSILLDIQ